MASDIVRVGLVQMNSRSDKEANLATAERLIDEAAEKGARLVGLPEYVSYLGPKELHEENAETILGPTTERFAAKARQHGIYLLGGSILERSDTPGMYYNTSTFFNPDGEFRRPIARSTCSTSTSPATSAPTNRQRSFQAIGS